ncbi:hypothetical protein [Bradyrhizobium sp. USDA 10063]
MSPELATRRPRDAPSAGSVSLADIAATSRAKKKEFKKRLWHRHFLHSRSVSMPINAAFPASPRARNVALVLAASALFAARNINTSLSWTLFFFDVLVYSGCSASRFPSARSEVKPSHDIGGQHGEES